MNWILSAFILPHSLSLAVSSGTRGIHIFVLNSMFCLIDTILQNISLKHTYPQLDNTQFRFLLLLDLEFLVLFGFLAISWEWTEPPEIYWCQNEWIFGGLFRFLRGSHSWAPKGRKRRSQAGPKGRHQEVLTWRAPRLLVICITFGSWELRKCCRQSRGPGLVVEKHIKISADPEMERTTQISLLQQMRHEWDIIGTWTQIWRRIWEFSGKTTNRSILGSSLAHTVHNWLKKIAHWKVCREVFLLSAAYHKPFFFLPS